MSEKSREIDPTNTNRTLSEHIGRRVSGLVYDVLYLLPDLSVVIGCAALIWSYFRNIRFSHGITIPLFEGYTLARYHTIIDIQKLSVNHT